MLTGDSEQVAASVAKELGIDEYFAGVLPDQKATKITLLQQQGHKVAMVGDGINDARASRSRRRHSHRSWNRRCHRKRRIILVKNNPQDVPKVIGFSKRTYSQDGSESLVGSRLQYIRDSTCGGSFCGLGHCD